MKMNEKLNVLDFAKVVDNILNHDQIIAITLRLISYRSIYTRIMNFCVCHSNKLMLITVNELEIIISLYSCIPATNYTHSCVVKKFTFCLIRGFQFKVVSFVSILVDKCANSIVHRSH